MSEAASVEIVILSPYQHELNGQGTDCASDCPACHWAAELAIATAPEKEENHASVAHSR